MRRPPRRAMRAVNSAGKIAALVTATLGVAACGDSATPVSTPAAASDHAAQIVGPVLLSGPSPFKDDCGLQGDFERDREGAAHLAVDPAGPDRIIVAWGQHRQSDGGWLGMVTAASGDGGRSWSRSALPVATRCTGGDHPHAADPWVAFGPSRRAYVSSIVTTIQPVSAGTLPSAAYAPAPGAVLVHRLEVGDAMWSDPAAVDPDDAGTLEDRDTLTPDPTDPNRLYLLWGKFLGAIPGPNLLYFSRSDDGGQTFSAGRSIYQPIGAAVLGVHGVVLPDGALVAVFGEISVPSYAGVVASRIRTIRSEDGGATWSAPGDIAEYCWCTPKEAETGNALASAGTTPSTAVGGDGTIYVGWVDQADGVYEIRYTRSRDGGRSWDAPAAAARVTAPAMLPALAAGANGEVALIWYDVRKDVPGDSQTSADWWMASSRDHGDTWAETHLAGPFDLRAALDTGSASYRLGDYFGLAATPGGFAAAIVQSGAPASSGPTDVFFVRVALAVGNKSR